MRILTDANLGNIVEAWLVGAGHDVLGVRSLDPSMPDADVLDLAVAEQRLLITLDKDFGELVYHSGRPHAGVLLLRIEDQASHVKVSVVREIFDKYADQLPGSFSVYSQGVLRVR